MRKDDTVTSLLLRLFGAPRQGESEAAARARMGKLAGFVGVFSNLLLFCLKLAVGLFSGSIAITADAVNNLSDCGSSVITLLGFRLGSIPADEKHPYGHARYEYLSGLAVSVLVLLIGFEFLKNAVGKIISPTPVAFSAVVGLVLAVSVVIKLWQGTFNKRVGREIGSGALGATATDSIGDALSTSSVLLAALVAHFTGLHLDGWAGALVALFVLVSGVRLIKETLDPLLGQAPGRELVGEIGKRIMSYTGVIGLHDLMVHNYGPGRCFASVHVEVPADQDIMESHDVIDNIERDFLEKMNIHLVAHMDPIVINDEETNEMRAYVNRVVKEYDPALSAHDFRIVKGVSHMNFIFDVVIPPRYGLTDNELRAAIAERVRLPGKTVYCVITVDRSYTSTTQGIGQE